MNYYAPIVLFAYNRPIHLSQVMEALQKNYLSKESELYVFSDGAKNEKDEQKVDEVRRYIKSLGGFKRINIIEREKNFGLAKNIIDGVTCIVNEHKKAIVLEDDLITSPLFLKFMNDALNMYENEDKVASIHGYIYPIKGLPDTFFIRGADCWGWATWERAWKYFEPNGEKLLSGLRARNLTKDFDFNNAYPYTKMLEEQIKGKNDSWAIRWYASAFLNDMLTLYPGRSFVRNIGFDSEGTHCKEHNNSFDVDIGDEISLIKIEVKENIDVRRKIESYFRENKSFFRKLQLKFKRLF